MVVVHKTTVKPPSANSGAVRGVCSKPSALLRVRYRPHQVDLGHAAIERRVPLKSNSYLPLSVPCVRAALLIAAVN